MQVIHMKGFYFGTKHRHGIITVSVKCHNINGGVNQPALRSIIGHNEVKSVRVAIANGFPDLGFSDFVAYIARPQRTGDANDDINTEFHAVIFRGVRRTEAIASFKNADLADAVFHRLISLYVTFLHTLEFR